MYAPESGFIVIDCHHEVPLKATHIACLIVVLRNNNVGRVLEPPVAISDGLSEPVLERAVIVLEAAGRVPFKGLQLIGVDKLEGSKV